LLFLQAGREEVDQEQASLCFILQVLLDAANETQRFRPSLFGLIDALKKHALEFGLGEQIGKILVAYGVDPDCQYDPLGTLFYISRKKELLETENLYAPSDAAKKSRKRAVR
jgi:hypothetical protein